MAQALVEIVAKLDRAQEHIDNLSGEVTRLIGDVPSRAIVDDDPHAREVFEKELSAIVVPVRMRIIAGEAIHQMRSALDHLVAKLVIHARNATDEKTQFPICIYRPTKPKEVRRVEANVRGVPAPALAIIESLQPYLCATPFDRRNHFLTILKLMNNRDKHHETVLSVVACKPTLRITVGTEPVDYIPDDPAETGPTVEGDIMDVKRQLTPHVVFPQFGAIQDQPVVDGLFRILMRVRFDVVRKFYGQF